MIKRVDAGPEEVSCDFCGSPVGARCRSRSGRVTGTHSLRWQAWHRTPAGAAALRRERERWTLKRLAVLKNSLLGPASMVI